METNEPAVDQTAAPKKAATKKVAAKKNGPITWKLVDVLASKLKPNPKNPKIKSRKGTTRLQHSLEKFGVVYDGICNADFTVIDGHSRLELNEDPKKKMKYFVPSRQLTPKEYKEMNAIFDIAKASDTNDLALEEMFTEEFFTEWDLDRKGKGDKKKETNAVYPLVQEYDEKYEAIVIVCNSSINTTFIKNALGIGREMSYKNKMVKETSIVTADQFIEKWNSKS